MLTAIALVLGIAIWIVSDIQFQTYGYAIGDSDGE